MNIFKVLFYINKGLINVYLYNGEKFISIESAGEREISYHEDFYNWLKSAIAYSDESDYLDYLIISDNSLKLEFVDFKVIESTLWSKEEIQLFIEFNDKYKFIKIELLDSELILQYKKRSSYFKTEEIHNLKVITNNLELNEFIEKIKGNNEDRGNLSKYYSNKIKKEREFVR